jgi:hypothetical protein
VTDLRSILLDAALGVTLAPIGVACALARAGLHALEGAARVSEELHAFADARRGDCPSCDGLLAENDRLRDRLRELADERDRAGNRAGQWEGRALAAEVKVGELDDLWQAVTEPRDAARAALATVQEGRDRWRAQAEEHERQRKITLNALEVAEQRLAMYAPGGARFCRCYQ